MSNKIANIHIPSTAIDASNPFVLETDAAQIHLHVFEAAGTTPNQYYIYLPEGSDIGEEKVLYWAKGPGLNATTIRVASNKGFDDIYYGTGPFMHLYNQGVLVFLKWGGDRWIVTARNSTDSFTSASGNVLFGGIGPN